MSTVQIKTICCIGAGYVGSCTMAVIAKKCPDIKVTVVDSNPQKIAAWNSGILPIFEPGLESIIKHNRYKNLFFSTEIDKAISEADCVFISVNTPTKISGYGAGKSSDLKYIELSARAIAKAAQGYTIVVEKSTVPVKSAEIIKSILESLAKDKKFDIISNPEFMAEGTAVEDLENPDRILIGSESFDAAESLSALYSKWVSQDRIITTNLWSSEMAKLAANAFLAQRVSSINSMAAFCEVSGADINEVALAIGMDSRIGSKFLKTGPGFGGSCFKKDISNLVYLCDHYGLNDVARYWEQVLLMNESHKIRIARSILSKMFNTIAGKRIAVLGLSFKKDTNDIRESPSISICGLLIDEGAEVIAFDPMVSANEFKSEISQQHYVEDRLFFSATIPEALDGADAVIILTDWDVFKEINWSKARNLMRSPAWVFDTRAILEPLTIIQAGLNYWSMGRNKYLGV